MVGQPVNRIVFADCRGIDDRSQFTHRPVAVGDGETLTTTQAFDQSADIAADFKHRDLLHAVKVLLQVEVVNP